MNNHQQYVTSRGYTLRFKSIPTLLQKVSQQHLLPEPPTYTPPTAPGIVAPPIPHYHRVIKSTEVGEPDRVETSLETEEEWEAWRAYLRRREEVGASLVISQLRLCLMEGITIIQRPTTNWEKRQRLIGLTIPEDPDEKELHFLETEIAVSAEDVVEILAGVSYASGIDEEAISALENSFRDSMGTRGELGSSNGHQPQYDSSDLEGVNKV